MGFHLNPKSTDILVGFPDRPGKRDLCIDYTCVCSFLPKYRSVASNDFEKHMGNVMKLKHDKHANYCMQAHNRDFHGLPASTLGRTGTSDFEEWARCAPRRGLDGGLREGSAEASTCGEGRAMMLERPERKRGVWGFACRCCWGCCNVSVSPPDLAEDSGGMLSAGGLCELAYAAQKNKGARSLRLAPLPVL